jgi:hypothetical protein
MAKEKRLNAKETFKRFADSFQKAGVTPETPNILKAWAAFKEFCQVPIARTTEGFIFHAGFKVDFPPPDHERVLDYSSYEVAFTRYWNVADTAHVAECSFRVADHPVLRNHEWEDVDIDAGEGDPALHQSRLEKFIKKVEAIADLWEVIRTAKASDMESYCGPQ